MKGYPKNLNSKADYLYVKANFPREQWQKSWSILLDNLNAWYFVKELENREAGVEDDTHKIVEEKKVDSDEVIYQQYELRECPSCKLFRLGFTVDEVETALAE